MISTSGHLISKFPEVRFHRTRICNEFKGNADTDKYQCTLTTPIKHRILDILPDRAQDHLAAYFSSVPKAERYHMKYFVCDMWTPYTELVKIYFPPPRSSLTNIILFGRLHGRLKTSTKGCSIPCLLLYRSIIKEVNVSITRIFLVTDN